MGQSREIDFENNAFDLFRLLAALQVMFGHIAEHYNLLDPEGVPYYRYLWRFSQYIPGRGVILFFVISGFLVIPSTVKHSTKEYMKNKAGRIFPGLWFAFLINTIAIALLYGFNGSKIDTFLYIFTQTTILQFYTGDWLRGYGAGTANGALWTITVLIQFYIIAVIFYKYMKNKSMKFWLLNILFFQMISFLIGNIEKSVPAILYKLINVSLLPYFYLFLIGMFVYEFRLQILPFLIKNCWFLAAAYLVITFLFMNIKVSFNWGVNYNIFSASILGFTAIGAAYRLGKIRFKYELSYGIFIYHMIIINIMMELEKRNHYIKFGFFLTLATISLTFLAAYLSTKFVEQPAKVLIKNIKMKNK